LQGDDVRTFWTVNAESNIKHYIVQHSKDGSSFNTIGTVKAINNSSGISNYQFIHANASVGKNYYRLVVADKDGTTKLSPVRLVTVSIDVQVNLYPNPVKSKLTVAFSNQGGKPGTIVLLTTFGQQLYEGKLSGSVTIDMSKYASGTYLLKIDSGQEVKTYKIQKQ
jgi:hypothetical protein